MAGELLLGLVRGGLLMAGSDADAERGCCRCAGSPRWVRASKV